MPVLAGFRQFVLRGNVVDLAVGVAIGAAFTAVVTALGEAFITPLVKLFMGGGVAGGTFTVNAVTFKPALVVNAVIVFLITAAVIYFLVVVPVNKIRDYRTTEPPTDEPQQQCPECLSSIPQRARRCAFCTSELPAGQPA
jgi:large conductance mechanosensitive channel